MSVALGTAGVRNQPQIVRKLFFRILLVQMAITLAPTVNVTIDGIIAGQYLSETEISVIRLQSLVDTFVALVFILIEGGKILLGEYIGRGRRGDLHTLISTLFLSLVGIGLALTLGLTVFCMPVSRLLGAEGECLQPCAQYVFTSALGIVPRLLATLLMNVVLLYHLERVNYVSTAAGVLINAGLDILLVGQTSLGIRGLGLATSLSYLVSFLVLLAVYLRKIRPDQEKTSHWNRRMLIDAAKNGSPLFSSTLGVLLGTYGINLSILAFGGVAGSAAGTVQRLILAVMTVFLTGGGNAFLIIGGILYNEEDRDALIRLTKLALQVLLILVGLLTILILLLREPITRIYFSPTDAAFSLTMQMLLIAPFYALPYVFYAIFYRLYQCEKRIRLANFFAIVESPGIAVCSLLLGFFFGLNGVWGGYVLMEGICCLLIWLYAGREQGRLCRSVEDVMLLPDSFGDKENALSLTVRSLEEVTNLSAQVVDFLQERGFRRRICVYAGLCVEEMAGNIVEHGFEAGKNHSIDIRLVCRDGQVTIHIRDNCRRFDPTTRLSVFNPEDPAANVGLRLVAGIADEMRYIDTLGLNTLVIRLGNGERVC